MASRGQSLELFFIDGSPDGMLTAEIFNWTGHVLLTPRIRLAEALSRTEATHTGVYILLGESDDSSLPRVYIGESDDVAARIRTHDANRDWWTQAVLITTSANTLNKAHVKYLEARLIEEARRAGRMRVENQNNPSRPSLSEAARSNMEQFVDYVLTIIPEIRVDGFIIKTRSLATKTGREALQHIDSPQFTLRLQNGEVDAVADLLEGEFVVRAGSFGRPKWIGVEHNYQTLFDELVDTGVYVADGTRRRFSKAYAFSSPSAAGAVLNGRATAGPTAWVLTSNPQVSYKQWEAEQLARLGNQDNSSVGF